jgi:hypothetical protein
MEQDLDEEDKIDDDVFNRIIWHAVRGYNSPYPNLSIVFDVLANAYNSEDILKKKYCTKKGAGIKIQPR